MSDAIQALHAQVQAWEEECANMGEIGRMRAFRQVRRKIEKLWPGVDTQSPYGFPESLTPLCDRALRDAERRQALDRCTEVAEELGLPD